MKQRKITAAVLALILILCLVGKWEKDLGSVQAKERSGQLTGEQMLERAIVQLNQADSVRTELVLDMDVKVLWLKTGMEAGMESVSFREPAKWRTSSCLDLGFLGKNGETIYAAEQKDGWQLVKKIKNEWKYLPVSEDKIRAYNGREVMQGYLEQVEGLELVGTGKVNGIKANKCVGTVKGEGVRKMLLDTGSLSVLSDLMEESVLGSLGTFLGQTEEVGLLLAQAGEVQVELWVDAKGGYPLLCRIDFTEMMRDAWDMAIGQIPEEGSKKERELLQKINVEQARIVLGCTDYNAAEDFAVPGL